MTTSGVVRDSGRNVAIAEGSIMYELIFITSVCMRNEDEESCEQQRISEYHASISGCLDKAHELWSETLSRGGRLTYSGCQKANGAATSTTDLYNFKHKDYSFRLNRIEIANFETSLLGNPASAKLQLRPGRTTRILLTIKF